MHIYAEVLNASGNNKDAYLFNDFSYNLLALEYKKVNTTAYAECECESKFNNEILPNRIDKENKREIDYIIY